MGLCARIVEPLLRENNRSLVYQVFCNKLFLRYIFPVVVKVKRIRLIGRLRTAVRVTRLKVAAPGFFVAASSSQ